MGPTDQVFARTGLALESGVWTALLAIADPFNGPNGEWFENRPSHSVLMAVTELLEPFTLLD
jgi:hypothetical protein